jgi:NaMN:DMB phosphoribosyltransferase
MTDPLWLLALIAAVGAGCFFAGWRSARAYLQAAESVSAITNAVADQANATREALDKQTAEYALLRAALNQNTKVIDEKIQDVETAMVTLFQGFERAGIVKRPKSGPGLQVGEASEE